MVVSAMASSDAKKGCDECKENCDKYSMWSALITGIAVAVIIVVLIVYIYSSRRNIAEAVHKKVGTFQDMLQKVAKQPIPHDGMVSPPLASVSSF